VSRLIRQGTPHTCGIVKLRDDDVLWGRDLSTDLLEYKILKSCAIVRSSSLAPSSKIRTTLNESLVQLGLDEA
jgi:hypothetical protein